MATAIKIVVFEDIEDLRLRFVEALKKHLKATDEEIVPFDGRLFEEEDDDRLRTYEDRIVKILQNKPYEGASLILADRDLSLSGDSGFRGLSVSSILTVAKRLALPVCSYAREPDHDDYDWRGQWEEGHIVLRLSDGEDEMTRRVSLAARGFSEIAEKLSQVMEDTSNNSAAKILAAVLEKPEYSEKIALYGVGDQNLLPDILVRADDPQDRVQKMIPILGYWLWGSLLRYPGLFVNETAAGSYLNIAEVDFHKQNVQKLFETALYTGPFADSHRKQWWRGMLDDIVSDQNFNDGLELAQKNVSSEIKPSQCSVDPTKSAGYYCIISRRPVSPENSSGGLSWFPRGADLTRISTEKLEEYGPWLGV